MPGAPRLVITAGLHGSASTNVFNIVRELMVAALGEASVVAVYGEDLPALPTPLERERRHVVLKSHGGSPALQWLTWLSGAPVLVSIRDPRDAVLSIMERFGLAEDDAVGEVERDCRHAMACADAGHAVLRYEDRFFDDPALPARLADRLGLALDAATCQAIGVRYGTAGMRAFAANLPNLPPGRTVRTDRLYYDHVTHIHATHIGDGLSGKWRDRPGPAEADALTRRFAPFLARFEYAP